MVDTLIANPPLSYGVRSTKKRNVSQMQFGDGRSQRATKGTNPTMRTFSLVWSKISEADMLLLEDYFDGLGGVDYFTWTPPGESEPVKFIEKGIDTSYDAYKNVTYTVSAEQVNDD